MDYSAVDKEKSGNNLKKNTVKYNETIRNVDNIMEVKLNGTSFPQELTQNRSSVSHPILQSIQQMLSEQVLHRGPRGDHGHAR